MRNQVKTLSQTDIDSMTNLLGDISGVLRAQYDDWQKKSFIKKQFMLSDFKKQMGLPAESFLQQLEALESDIRYGEWDAFIGFRGMFIKLTCYLEHQAKLLFTHEKDPARLARNASSLNVWIAKLQELIELLPA
jgi:hypothetical protein